MIFRERRVSWKRVTYSIEVERRTCSKKQKWRSKQGISCTHHYGKDQWDRKLVDGETFTGLFNAPIQNYRSKEMLFHDSSIVYTFRLLGVELEGGPILQGSSL